MAKSGVCGRTVDPYSAVCGDSALFAEVGGSRESSGRVNESLEGGLTRCYGVFDHGLHLRRNIALRAA